MAVPDQRAILGLGIQLGMIASLLIWGVMQVVIFFGFVLSKLSETQNESKLSIT